MDLGYTFRTPELLRLALTHSSASRTNNERLEFLGDSVLGMVVAEYLYRQAEYRTEGELANTRAGVVANGFLYHAAIRLGIPQAIILGGSEEKSGGRNKHRLLANAVEAVIGAIYLDGGLEAARSFIITRVMR